MIQNQIDDLNPNITERIKKFPSKPPLPHKRNNNDDMTMSMSVSSLLSYEESLEFIKHAMNKNKNLSINNKAPPGLPGPILADKSPNKKQKNVNPDLEETKTEKNGKNYRSRRRSKRRNKNKNKNKKNKFKKLCDENNDEVKQQETDDEDNEIINNVLENENERNDEDIWISKKNMINAIEIERRNHELTKLKLVQLHEFHMENIKKVKKENDSLTKKLRLYSKHKSSEDDIKKLESQVQKMKETNKESMQNKINDTQQLQNTDKENQKLSIILHYLRQQLTALQAQYQALCNQHAKSLKEISGNNNCSMEVEDIINDINSLNIMDTESFIEHDECIRLRGSVMHCNKNGTPFIDAYCEHNGGGRGVGLQLGCKQHLEKLIAEDAWFQKMIDENGMLERHIRFMRHIIESEQKRCDFKQLIIGINNNNNNNNNDNDNNDNDKNKDNINDGPNES